MKKLGLLIAVSFFMTACDMTPGGNKGILPVTHDGNSEQVDQTAKPAEEASAASNDTIEENTVNQTEKVTPQTEETKTTDQTTSE